MSTDKNVQQKRKRKHTTKKHLS